MENCTTARRSLSRGDLSRQLLKLDLGIGSEAPERFVAKEVLDLQGLVDDSRWTTLAGRRTP
jgi:hypothetical protein